MRILHVTPEIDPAMGGSVEAVRQMSKAMKECGAHVEVLSVSSAKPEWLDEWPVPVRCLGKTATYYRYSPLLVPWLKDRHSSFDAIIVHGLWRYATAGVWRAVRGRDIPYFVFAHGMFNSWPKGALHWKNVKKSVFWKTVEHRVLRDARSVLFTTEEERTIAHRAYRPYECREEVVGMGIASPPSAQPGDREAFYGRFPMLRNKRIVLFAGRLHPWKGCDLLIRAFSAVAGVDSRLHLLMAGADQIGWRSDLEDLAAAEHVADRITWADHISGSTKWQAFRSAEVLALPSHGENFAVAVAEALACGTPVLLSDKVGTWREVCAGDAGFVEPDTLEGAVSLVRRWINTKSGEREALRASARRVFERCFRIEDFTSRFLQHLNRELDSEKVPCFEMAHGD